MSRRIGRIIDRIKKKDRSDYDSGSDSGSDSWNDQYDKPRRKTPKPYAMSERYGTNRNQDQARYDSRPSPAPPRSQSPRPTGPGVSAGRMPQQQQNAQSRQPQLNIQNNPSRGAQPERPLPFSKSQRQHRVPKADTSQMSPAAEPGSGVSDHPAYMDTPTQSTEYRPHRTPDVSSRPVRPPGVPPGRMGSPVETAEEGVEIAMNRKEALDCLQGTIPATVFNMPDFAAWRTSKTPAQARLLAGVCGMYGPMDFYRFMPRVQYGLTPKPQKAMTMRPPPLLAEVPIKAARTESMKARLEEMKATMKQTQEAAENRVRKPPPPSRLPIPRGEHSRRVPKHQVPTFASPKSAEDEDADLRAAIAASIADVEEQRKRSESRLPTPRGEHSRRVPKHQVPTFASPKSAEDEDADLRAAIAASMADVEEQRKRSESRLPRYVPPPERQRRRPQAQVFHPRPMEAPTRPPPAPPRVPKRSSRGNPRDPRTGEVLSEDAWNAQI
ncbi:hypothetical protein CONLIGDRAFT_639621 [Coniochaeta ligniaria NRRL 30616]|uniref:Uncharacterized protein n=1 Tax=Coniochaeta ligniaria NRRL 30616 TaxID=1408157 RepID=A0A1J7K0V2_9PEZI|nr:hypothetical protein CONLIGDRAFT_639621 [Coniochaeta ligniaria NRRL 30616]